MSDSTPLEDKLAATIAEAQNAPFVGPEQRKIAAAVLEMTVQHGQSIIDAHMTKVGEDLFDFFDRQSFDTLADDIQEDVLRIFGIEPDDA